MLNASAALAGSHDILHHSKARILRSPSLAEENVSRQNSWGVLQGLVSVLVPFGILALASSHPGQSNWDMWGNSPGDFHYGINPKTWVERFIGAVKGI